MTYLGDHFTTYIYRFRLQVRTKKELKPPMHNLEGDNSYHNRYYKKYLQAIVKLLKEEIRIKRLSKK